MTEEIYRIVDVEQVPLEQTKAFINSLYDHFSNFKNAQMWFIINPFE